MVIYFCIFRWQFCPAGRGGDLAPGLSLFYNSKLWKTTVFGYTDFNGVSHTQYDVAIDPDGGWQYGLRYHWRFYTRYEDSPYPYDGGTDDCAIEDVVYQNVSQMIFPDGSSHTIHPRGFREIDGFSQVLPNGFGSCTNYNPAVRSYYTTDGSSIRVDFTPRRSGNTTLQPAWTMYFPDGQRVTDDGDGNQTTYDRNGNYVQVIDFTYNSHSATRISDQLGREIILEHDSANNRDYLYQQGYNGEQLKWTLYYQTIAVNKQYAVGDIDQNGDPIIRSLIPNSIGGYSQIQLPAQMGGQSYFFSYDGVNNNGELKSVTLPSGARTDYGLTYDGSAATRGAKDFLKNAINRKTLTYDAEYDGNPATPVSETWLYTSAGIRDCDGCDGTPIGPSAITAPNGSETVEYYLQPGSGSSYVYSGLEGLPIKTIHADGSVSERIWQLNKIPSRDAIVRTPGRPAEPTNAFIKTEFISLVRSNGTLIKTAIRDNSYDKNSNVTQTSEYDFVKYVNVPRDDQDAPTGIPAGIVPLRVTQKNFYNAVPDSTDITTNSPFFYANGGSPNVHQAVAAIETGVNGSAASRQEFVYDDADTTANLTEMKSWDSTKAGYSNPLSSTNSISTTTDYDANGNPILLKDAGGNFTQITYGVINGYTNLYPTQIVTAYGTPIKRTVAVEFDFLTGSMKKSADVDNNVSTEMEIDALGRTTKVKAAVGTAAETWSQTIYDDVNRMIVAKTDIETVGDGREVSAQFYDQLGRVRLTKTLENAATQSATNEMDGIKVQTRYLTSDPFSYQWTSNPYRAATSAAAGSEESMGWTRSRINNTGRHSEIETFKGAAFPGTAADSSTSTGIVSTDIDADRTLVTDQAGKRRVSRMNALSQLADVWEITAAEEGQTEPVIFGNPILSLNGYKTSYAYDVLGNLTTVTQGVQTRTFAYDSLLRLKTAQSPESGVTGYIYDDNGNLTRKTDARGVQTSYDYDALNRVLNRSYSAPANLENYQAALPVTYVYDNPTIANSKGRLTQVFNGLGRDSFSVTNYQAFDQLGRVTQSQQITDKVSYNPMTYKYNLAGALIEETYPSTRVVQNVLNNEGDLSIVKSKKISTSDYFAYATDFSYTAAGAVSSMRLGNSNWESTIFNSRLQPTQIALGTTTNGTDRLKLEFTYSTSNPANNNGNVVSQKITTPSETVGGQSHTGFTATQNYIYDSLNRIKQATETIAGQTPLSWQQTFDYDRYGNRTFDEANTTTLPAGCQQAVCNPAIDPNTNKLIGYTFDNAGNTTKDAQGKKFTYDGENKQTKVETIDGNGNVTGTLGEYFYDSDGKRVKKMTYPTGQPAETTIFIYDASGRMVAEYSTTVAPSATSQVSYLTSDHLGSPRINMNKSGTVSARHDYQPFGEEIFRSGYGGDNVRQKFTSYEHDNESGLDNAQARMYGNSHGRFTSPDPYNPIVRRESSYSISLHAAQPQNWNKYAYCFNNPHRYVDRDGESPTIVSGAIGALIGGVIGAGIETAKQAIFEDEFDGNKIGGAAVQGIIFGGVAGLTVGVSLVYQIPALAAANAVGGVANRAISNDPASQPLNGIGIGIDLVAGGVGAYFAPLGTSRYLAATEATRNLAASQSIERLMLASPIQESFPTLMNPAINGALRNELNHGVAQRISNGLVRGSSKSATTGTLNFLLNFDIARTVQSASTVNINNLGVVTVRADGSEDYEGPLKKIK